MYNLSMAKDAKVYELWNGSTWYLRLRRGIFDREMNAWLGMLSLLSQTRLNGNDDVVLWKLEGSDKEGCLIPGTEVVVLVVPFVNEVIVSSHKTNVVFQKKKIV